MARTSKRRGVVPLDVGDEATLREKRLQEILDTAQRGVRYIELAREAVPDFQSYYTNRFFQYFCALVLHLELALAKTLLPGIEDTPATEAWKSLRLAVVETVLTWGYTSQSETGGFTMKSDPEPTSISGAAGEVAVLEGRWPRYRSEYKELIVAMELLTEMNDKENTTDKLWSTLVRLYTVEEHNGVISIPMPDEPAIVLLQQICLDALRRRKGRCLESNEIYDEMKRVFKCFGCSRAWNSHIPLLPASTTIIASGKRITIETSGETWKYLTDLNRDRRDARDRRLISCSGPYREYLKYISEDICSQVEEGDSKEARASRKAYHKKLHQTPERVADKIEVPGLFLTLKPTGDFKHARFLCACRFRSKEPFASAPLPEATDNFVLLERCLVRNWKISRLSHVDEVVETVCLKVVQTATAWVYADNTVGDPRRGNSPLINVNRVRETERPEMELEDCFLIDEI